MKKSSSPTKSKGPRSVQPDAAGIDLGSRDHWVALPPGRTDSTVRRFGCFTEDLQAMAAWLIQHGIKTVAIESTGVYWVPVYQVLERHGIDVHLVNAQHFKIVPGRKTDIQDCQWLQHLHESGLLRGSFRPADAICVIRSYVRQRENLVGESSRRMLRMQKSLDQMNIQLHKVVSDIMGETGLAIIKAILAGERDPAVLAGLRNYRCHSSADEIAKALVGDWREEHLFCLEQDLAAYEFVQNQIAECEQAALRALQQLDAKAIAADLPATRKPKADAEARQALFVATGVDLTKVSGLKTTIVQTIVAETGVDMSKWHSEKAFASWCRLAPGNRITGGKRHRMPKHGGASRVGQAFRVAAQTLARSDTALGAFYRRMRSRKGSTFANAVTAHKLAKLFYRMLKYGEGFIEQDTEYYETRYKERLVKGAVARLHQLGFDVDLKTRPALAVS